MDPIELFAGGLAQNEGMVKSTLADFSDADMLVRPTPKANHAAWQLGHLLVAETRMIESISPGAGAKLPDGFAAKFTKESAASDDPAAFPKKAELLDLLTQVRAASVKWVKGLTPADLDKPAPESMRRFAATLAQAALLLPIHTTMHVGQFQVIRRALGKPVLF